MGCASIYISLLQNECDLLGFQPPPGESGRQAVVVLVVTFRGETSNHRSLAHKRQSESQKEAARLQNALKVTQAEWTSCTSERIAGSQTGSSRFPTVSGRKGPLEIRTHPPLPCSLGSRSAQAARPIVSSQACGSHL